MGPPEASAALVRRLVAAIRADREALVRRTAEVERYSDLGAGAPVERPAALALALDRAYTGLESILERVARELEGGLPRGEDWHAALLAGARLAIEDTRPPVLGERSSAVANEVRRFRHFLRYAYGAELDGSRLRALAVSWTTVAPEIADDLDRFERFLGDLAGRLERLAR